MAAARPHHDTYHTGTYRTPGGTDSYCAHPRRTRSLSRCSSMDGRDELPRRECEVEAMPAHTSHGTCALASLVLHREDAVTRRGARRSRASSRWERSSCWRGRSVSQKKPSCWRPGAVGPLRAATLMPLYGGVVGWPRWARPPARWANFAAGSVASPAPHRPGVPSWDPHKRTAFGAVPSLSSLAKTVARYSPARCARATRPLWSHPRAPPPPTDTCRTGIAIRRRSSC